MDVGKKHMVQRWRVKLTSSQQDLRVQKNMSSILALDVLSSQTLIYIMTTKSTLGTRLNHLTFHRWERRSLL